MQHLGLVYSYVKLDLFDTSVVCVEKRGLHDWPEFLRTGPTEEDIQQSAKQETAIQLL